MKFARAFVPSFVLGSFLALAACGGATDADSLAGSAEAGGALTVTSLAGSGREITYTFNRAVVEVTAAASRLIFSLETSSEPRNREVEAEKARERAKARFG